MPAVPANREFDGAFRNSPKKSKAGPAVVVALALSAVAGLVWWNSYRLTPDQSVEPTLLLDTFIVNLSGSNQRAYLRTGITLGLARPLPNQQGAVPTALVRDTILSVLASAEPEQLLKLEGKEQLKDELRKKLQERVPQIAVVNVYFTEFLVQM
jgi:flagellar basal body-associated protein FliL